MNDWESVPRRHPIRTKVAGGMPKRLQKVLVLRSKSSAPSKIKSYAAGGVTIHGEGQFGRLPFTAVVKPSWRHSDEVEDRRRKDEGGRRETGDERFIFDCWILAFGAYGWCKRY
jgi:hypothetical protein